MAMVNVMKSRVAMFGLFLGICGSSYADEAQLLPGFPVDFDVSVPHWLFLQDLDGDGTAEIIRSQTQKLDGTTEDIHVVGPDGQYRAGFPVVFPLPAHLTSAPSTRVPILALDLDGDGDRELISLLERGFHQIHAYNSDGTSVPGWPISLAGIDASVRFWAGGDLDGDGDDELVLSSRPIAGKRTRVTRIDGDGSIAWDLNFDYVQTYPVSASSHPGVLVVGDLDGDGSSEIVANIGIWSISNVLGGETLILDGDGATLEQWSSAGGGTAAADFNGDGVPELIGISQYGYTMRNLDGTPRIPGTTGGLLGQTTRTGFSPALGDLDGDGTLDLGYMGQELEIIRPDVEADFEADLLAGLPFQYQETLAITPATDNYIDYESAVFADVDGDGVKEVIAVSKSGTPGNNTFDPMFVHVYRQNLLEELPGWPKQIPDTGYPQETTRRVAVGDVDGDGDLEVVYSSWFQLFAWSFPQVADPIPGDDSGWMNYYGNGKWNRWYHEGRIPRFLRGDFDGDGALSLGDAIGLLEYMFVEGEAGDCLAASDFDGDGNVLINDAILLLDYMFVPGSPQPLGGLQCETVGFAELAGPCERFACQ